MLNITSSSHHYSYGLQPSAKVPVLPQFPRPKSLHQSYRLVKYIPHALTLDDRYYFPSGKFGRERYHNVDMINRYFHLDNTVTTIFLSDLLQQLSRSFSKSLRSKIFFRNFGHHTKWYLVS